MSRIELALNDIACSGCMRKIKRGIKKNDGVEKVEILPGSGKIQISFNEKIIQLNEINRSLHKLTLRIFD